MTTETPRRDFRVLTFTPTPRPDPAEDVLGPELVARLQRLRAVQNGHILHCLRDFLDQILRSHGC